MNSYILQYRTSLGTIDWIDLVNSNNVEALKDYYKEWFKVFMTSHDDLIFTPVLSIEMRIITLDNEVVYFENKTRNYSPQLTVE